MKTSQTFLIGFLVIVWNLTAQAGLLYTYNRLALKDLDQMNKLVKEKIKEARPAKGANSDIPLREAVQAVFSRPNEDFMIEKIITPLKNELDDQWEKTLNDLVTESLGALKNSAKFQPQAQVTYAIFLENLIAEVKPKGKEKFENALLVRICDANIQISKAAQNERGLRMMKEIISPSILAKDALEEINKPKAPVPEATEAKP